MQNSTAHRPGVTLWGHCLCRRRGTNPRQPELTLSGRSPNFVPSGPRRPLLCQGNDGEAHFQAEPTQNTGRNLLPAEGLEPTPAQSH
jgi:hypothetical protein